MGVDREGGEDNFDDTKLLKGKIAFLEGIFLFKNCRAIISFKYVKISKSQLKKLSSLIFTWKFLKKFNSPPMNLPKTEKNSKRQSTSRKP
jgi:hypothetical protein